MRTSENFTYVKDGITFVIKFDIEVGCWKLSTLINDHMADIAYFNSFDEAITEFKAA